MEKIAILGASRGLGAELAVRASHSCNDLLLIARKIDLLRELKTSILKEHPDHKIAMDSADFSKEAGQDFTLSVLRDYRPQRLIYVAGGGPYGNFEQKGWKDHMWAFQVSFLFAARVLHESLRQLVPELQQIVIVGSSIAEKRPDPGASSYCAAKHALVGLVQSVQAESPQLDIRLFSPGYMDTELLPMNAWPRQMGEPLIDPQIAAEEMWGWAMDARYHSDHYRFTSV